MGPLFFPFVGGPYLRVIMDLREMKLEKIKETIDLSKKVLSDYKRHSFGLVLLNAFCFITLFFSLYLYIRTAFDWWSYLFLGVNSFVVCKSAVSSWEYRKRIVKIRTILPQVEDYYQKISKEL